MSLGRYMVAVRDALRARFSALTIPALTNSKSIMLMPDQRPAPYCGEHFIAIHALTWSPFDVIDPHRGIDEAYAFSCTLTRRTGAFPFDSEGEAFVKDLISMEDACRVIMTVVHQSVPILVAATAAIQADSAFNPTDGITEYARWLRTTVPVPVSADHFHAYVEPHNEGSLAKREYGLMCQVQFGRVRRRISFEKME